MTNPPTDAECLERLRVLKEKFDRMSIDSDAVGRAIEWGKRLSEPAPPSVEELERLISTFYEAVRSDYGAEKAENALRAAVRQLADNDTIHAQLVTEACQQRDAAHEGLAVKQQRVFELDAQLVEAINDKHDAQDELARLKQPAPDIEPLLERLKKIVNAWNERHPHQAFDPDKIEAIRAAFNAREQRIKELEELQPLLSGTLQELEGEERTY